MTLLIAVQCAIAALVALAYLGRARHLRRSGVEAASRLPGGSGAEAIPAWRLLCFLAGIATIIAAVAALEGPSRKLLYLAMLQRVLIGDIATLLIVLGLTAAVLRPLTRLPLVGRLRLLTRPSLALPLWIVNVAAWHVPAVYEFALVHRSLTVLAHVLLAALGIAVWASLLGPGGHRFKRRGRMLAYLLSWRLTGVIAGNFAIWWPEVIYSHYVQADTAYSLSPLADQGIAGAIVFGVSALIAIGLLVWIYLRDGRGAAPQPSIGVREEPVLAAK